MTKQPSKAGLACPECGSREVALRAFASRIKNVRAIGVTRAESQQAPDGSAFLKKKGKTTYRWQCTTCGHKFTAPHKTDVN